MLFLLDPSALLHLYLQCVHSTAPVAKVGPLATVSGLLITHSAWQHFTRWLAEHLAAGLFQIAFPLPSHPLPLNILVIGGCYSLAYLQSPELSSPFFHSFISMVLIIIVIGNAIIILL